jgi:hypothetical protein
VFIEGVGEVDAEDLLALLDAENVHEVGSEELGFSCLYVAGHVHGDRNPSCHINRESLCSGAARAVAGRATCSSSCASGCPAARFSRGDGLAARALRRGRPQARGGSLTADLEQRLQRARYVPPARRLPNEAETIGPQGIFALDWRSDHEAAAYMRGRGFAPEVLEDWGFGFDTWTQRVAIPVRDADGVLVGFKGRALARRRGQVPPARRHRGPRAALRHGLRLRHARPPPGPVRPRPRARAPARLRARRGRAGRRRLPRRRGAGRGAGHDVDHSRSALAPARHFDELVLFYDSDKAGEDAVWGSVDEGSGKWRPGWVEKISPYFTLLVCDDHEGDPAAMAPEQVRSLLPGQALAAVCDSVRASV